MTLARRASALLLAATAACSPSTARRGELAAVLDSLVPRDAPVTCRDPAQGSAGRPPYRQCRQDRPLVFFDLGRDGMVQTVSERWAGDSAGGARARALLAGAAGLVHDTSYALAEHWRWSTAAVGHTLYRERVSGEFLHVRWLLTLAPPDAPAGGP